MDKQANGTYTTTVLAVGMALLVVTSMGVGVVTAQDEFDVTLDVPQDVTAGEQTTLSASVSVPDLLRDYENDLTVTFSVDGTQVGAKTVTITDGTTKQIDLTHTFENSGTKEVTVTAETSLGGQDFSGSASATVDVNEPPVSIDGDLSTSLSVPESPTVGDETTITIENAIPEFTNAQEGYLTVNLFVGQQEIASRNVSVQAGDIKDIEVFHTFETTDQVTVKADATLVVGDKTATGDASTTVQAQEPLAIDGNVSSTLRVPDSPTVGNETTITVENSIPELSGTQDAELNVRLLIDGTQIDSRSITAQEAQTETVDFSYVFDTTDEATVTVEVTLTVGGQSTSDRVSKPVQPQEPLAIDGELSSSISVPDNPTVGEETTITVSNRIPEFSGTQQGNLTLQLFVDGDRVDSKSITVQEAGTQEVTFIHTYQTTEATNVEINATLSIGTIATTKTPSETVQPVLSIDGQLSSNLSISDDPTVGEPTTISIEHTIPEFSGRQNGNLTIHLLINGNRVDTKTATVTAGEVSSVEFTRTFENTDEKTITVEATLSVGNQAVNASASQRIRPIGINEELSLRILTPDSPTVGEETVISVENEIPSFTGVQEGTLTLRLLIDGDEITTREVDVESGDLKTVEFNHTFETSEETTVSVEATLTVGTLNVSTSREIFIQPQEALSIDGRLAGEISLSQTPVVGEEVTLTVDTTVPEFTGVQEGQLRLHLSRNGTEINSINITVESGDQPSVEFTPRVETAGPTEFTVNGSLTLRNRTLNMNLSQPIRPQEPISGGDELPTNLTVVGSPRVGKETTITINNRIPSLTGTGNGELTLRLLIDGEEVASKNITIAGDEREETNFSYEFDASGETTVTVKAILTVAGQTVSGSATQTVDVGEALPETTTLEGAAFTVPDSLQDEVNAYRNSVSEEVGASAFVLATREDLYIVFTSDEPSKGKAIVEGITLNRTLSEGNLTYGAIAATNTTFATNGTEVSLETVADNPDQYRLELVQITAHHRRISTLTDPDGGGDFTLSSTAGVLLEQPRTPSSLLQNLTGKARTLSGNISTEEIETILDTPRRTHLRTFSFETAFWADTEATVDGIVLEPGSTARQFINEYDQAGTVDAEEGRPILYVVNEDFQPREMADVNSIKSQADALNGEVVTTEVLLNQQRISIQETLEHSTGCNPDLLQIQTPQGPVCVNVVQDNLLHGGVAWNNVPQSRDDVLLVVGVSSRHQDVPAATEQGRYQLTGEVVSTARLNESLPDGSVLIIYELDRKDDINYDELREEARAIIESRLEQVRDRLREQLIEIAGEPATNLSLAENITTGEETPITAETRIPQLTGAQSGQLTLTLFVDGNETANKTFTVEGNSSETVNFTHVFSADGETTVTVQANLTAGGQTITRNVSRTVFVGERFPDLTTIRGAAFAVPESLEDEVQAYRANTSEDLNASAFILATQTELYVVFTDRQPTKGRATVKGIVLNRTVSGENLTYGAVAATDTSFETTGNETTVQAVADNSEQYRLELVRITANYRRISTLTDPDQGDDFTLSTTSGLLLENPRTATSLFQNLSGKARHLSWNTSTDRIDEALNHSRRTHLHTFSFETKFWTDAEATVDAIVLDPSSAAQQFIDEYDRPGVAHAEDGEPILYVVEEDFHPQSMENVASIKSQADSLDGEVVKTTVRLYQKRVSVQETVEHNTGCSEDRLEIQTPEGSVCVNVVQDNLRSSKAEC